MEYLLKKFVSGQSDLTSSLSRKINVGSLNAVSDLAIQKEVLFLDVLKKFLTFSKILLGILSN
jgi:hypothetical protein